MYRVLRDFADLQDREHIYRAGDTFPRSGLSPDEGRIAELSSPRNRLGVPLIEQAEEPESVAVKEPEPVTAEEPKKTEDVKKATTTRKKKNAG